MQKENGCQSPNLESQDILILLSLKPRPLHLEGLEPNFVLCPTTTTASQDMQLVFPEPHPPCCLEPMFSKAHPEPHQEAAFPLWEGVSH